MNRREFHRRMDVHMREIKHEVALTRDEVELTREEVRLSREQRVHSDRLMDRLEARLDRDAEEHADLRAFIREMTVRMQRTGDAQVAELRRFGAQMSAEMQDLREESRAQRSALLALIDRLNGPQPGDAAA